MPVYVQLKEWSVAIKQLQEQIYSNLLANSMDPDQTAPYGAV